MVDVRQVSGSVQKVIALAGAVTLVGAVFVGVPPAFAAGPSTISTTFGYTVGAQSFTVPDGVTQLTVSMLGGEGGRGGADAAGPSPAGGYQGSVTGTMPVTPGQVLTIGVGSGGNTGASDATGATSPPYDAGAALGGTNPLGAYSGGAGGVAGYTGDSGDGGAGGAATVIETGGVTIVAGGSGGAGGSGQYLPTLGRLPSPTFSARTDTVSTGGQTGITVQSVCTLPGATSCDGGGGGAGGGGAVGGAQGDVQFGSGTSNEWYGYGGFPGQNSTGGVSGLTDSYQYYADNAANGSVTISYTTGTPSAPTGVSGSGLDSSVALSWSPPASAGGSAITDYVVEYAPAASPTSWTTFADGVGTDTSTVVTGLTDDTAYVFRVTAVNATGAGDASVATDPIAPVGPPTAPAITSITPSDGSLSVAFTPATSDSPITDYEYRLGGSGPWISSGSTTSPLSISGLTNGTTYSVQIRAVSAIGDGAASDAASASTSTPVSPPGGPRISLVSAGDTSASISFTPGYSGGQTATDYEYQLDGSGSWTSAATTLSPLTITGLTSRTVYVVAVRGVNAAGPGAPSQPLTVTTAADAGSTIDTTVPVGAAPDAPTVVLTPGAQSISVAFTLGSAGGSAVTGVEYRLGGGSWVGAGTLSSPFTIGALDNGTSYSVEVRADNAAGPGTASTPASSTPYTVPGAPVSVIAQSDTGQSDVSWTAPASDGGSSVISYTASAFASPTSTSAVTSCATGSDDCTISGLTNGISYYVSVVATNAAGSGIASAPRVAVTPQARPAAPTLNTLTAGNTLVTLAFSAGGAGSSPITGYQYQLNGSDWQNATSTSSPLVVSGLQNGTSYAVALRAVSAFGAGTASSILTATPFTYPDAPAAAQIVADGQDSSIAVSWAAPSANGSAITGYTATAFSAPAAGTPQGTACTTTGALSCTITGLTNDTTYYVSLQAQNAAGLSSRSDPRVAATPSLLPGAPTAVTAAAGDGQVDLTWSAGSTGASPISDYTVWYSDGGTYTQFPDGTSTNTAATVTDLTNGTAYTFEVSAVNGNGTGPASLPSAAVTPLAPGVSPTASAPTSTDDGFTFTIQNYLSSTSYEFSATNGATVTRTGSTVTVSGLAAGDSSTVTVSASVPGHAVASVAVSGAALLAGIVPTFSAISRSLDGFSFQITNYDSAQSYSLSATNRATLTQAGATVVVSGLAPGATSGVAVTVTRDGYTGTEATASGSALGTGTAPELSDATQTADGFTFTIENYSTSLVYSFTATGGATVTSVAPDVVVSGLGSGAASDVTVTAIDPGHSTSSATIQGTALLAGVAPELSTPTSLAGGYQLTIDNYDAGTDYALVATNGATPSLTGATVTLTGLAAGASAVVTVTAERTGSQFASANATGSALQVGVDPTFTVPVGTPDGFDVSIANYSAGITYLIAVTDSAQITRTAGLISVIGLGADRPATVTVTAMQPGHLVTSASVTGRSNPAFIPTPPSPPAAGTTPGGSTTGGTSGGSTTGGTTSGATTSGSSTTSGTSSGGVANGGLSSGNATAGSSAGTSSVASSGGTHSGAVPAIPWLSAAQPPAVGEQAPGTGSVTVDGAIRTSTLTAHGSSLWLTAGGLTMHLSALGDDGGSLPLSATGDVIVQRGGKVRVAVAGFRQGSTTHVWCFSTATALGDFTVDADGTWSGEITLPMNILAGNHTIALAGTTTNGATGTTALGITVIDAPAPATTQPGDSAPAHRSGSLAWVLAPAALVLVLGILILAWRRRRHDEAEVN